MFPREVFEACPNLKAVSRTGVGYDEIDVEAATEYGVAVCNVPGYGTEVVSDHAITLALSVLRRINELDADMRRGVWDYARTRPLGSAAVACSASSAWVKSAERRPRKLLVWALRWCAGRVA